MMIDIRKMNREEFVLEMQRSQGRREAMIDMYQDGMGIGLIASAFGVPIYIVRKCLGGQNVEIEVGK